MMGPTLDFPEQSRDALNWLGVLCLGVPACLSVLDGTWYAA